MTIIACTNFRENSEEMLIVNVNEIEMLILTGFMFRL